MAVNRVPLGLSTTRLDAAETDMIDLQALSPSHLLRRSFVRIVGVGAVLGLLLAGCSSAAATPTPTTAPTSQAVISASPAVVVTPTPVASQPTPVRSPSGQAAAISPAPTHLAGPSGSPGTIDTSTGKVWDALPASFPIYPGLEAAPQPGMPTSGNLAMAGDHTSELVSWYGKALVLAGYDVGAPSPALEDGTRHLVAHRTGQSGCAVDVAIAPTGTMTFVSIGFGTGCAFS